MGFRDASGAKGEGKNAGGGEENEESNGEKYGERNRKFFLWFMCAILEEFKCGRIFMNKELIGQFFLIQILAKL
jgi:hypothetical protein